MSTIILIQRLLEQIKSFSSIKAAVLNKINGVFMEYYFINSHTSNHHSFLTESDPRFDVPLRVVLTEIPCYYFRHVTDVKAEQLPPLSVVTGRTSSQLCLGVLCSCRKSKWMFSLCLCVLVPDEPPAQGVPDIRRQGGGRALSARPWSPTLPPRAGLWGI